MKNSLVYLLATVVAGAVVWWCYHAANTLSLHLLIPFALVGIAAEIFLIVMSWKMALGILLDTGKTPDSFVGLWAAEGIVFPAAVGISFSAAVFGNSQTHMIVLWYFGIAAALLAVAWCAGLALVILQDVEKKRSDAWLEDLLKKRETKSVS